jgi:uncharacterized protein
MVYGNIAVTDADLDRLAKHFNLPLETTIRLCTRDDGEKKVLRRRQDEMFESTCIFLDVEKHNCNVYDARPGVCQEYPGQSSCPYYELLEFERDIQENENTLVKITFWHEE